MKTADQLWAECVQRHTKGGACNFRDAAFEFAGIAEAAEEVTPGVMLDMDALKRIAYARKKESGQPHHIVLAGLAQEHGYPTWPALVRATQRAA